jgi:hypothetical protein
MRPPSPYELERAVTALLTLRDQLLDIDPDLADDAQLWANSLDGEGGEALDVVDLLIRASIDADGLAIAAKVRGQEIAERQKRFELRRNSMRRAAFAIFDALQLHKHEREDFTASIRAGTPHVDITDDKALPDEFVRIKREPDKALIGEALKRREEVPGAVLSNAGPSLAVRRR